MIFNYFYLDELFNSKFNAFITNPSLPIHCFLRDHTNGCGSVDLLDQTDPDYVISIKVVGDYQIERLMQDLNSQSYRRLKSLILGEIVYDQGDFEKLQLILERQEQLEYFQLKLDCSNEEKYLVEFFRLISMVQTLRTLIFNTIEGNSLSFDSQMFADIP